MSVDRSLNTATLESELSAAGEGVSPVRANLLAAREIAYPGLDPALALATIQSVVDGARVMIASEPATQRGLALADYLFGTLGYSGDRAAYHDPRNSYMHEVVSRRRGLPISLSALYVHVARELGVDADGVGLPGHFIVRAWAGDDVVYLDPFNGGARIGAEECRELVAETTGYTGAFDPRWLTPTPPREIVVRMLNNLRNGYTQDEEWELARRTIGCLTVLQPAAAAHLRDLGLLDFRLGQRVRAAQRLALYLARAPGADDVNDVRQLREQILNDLGRLN